MKDKLKFLGILLAAIMMLSMASCVTVTKNPTGAAVADDDLTEVDLEDEDISDVIDEVESLADEAEEAESVEDTGLPTKTVAEGELISFPNLLELLRALALFAPGPVPSPGSAGGAGRERSGRTPGPRGVNWHRGHSELQIESSRLSASFSKIISC